MKARILTAFAAVTLTIAGTTAQTAVDAYSITQPQLRGTARFLGMGGAFTSLGGDISSINQNPAGLGFYRHSDFALTFDVSIQSYKSATASDKTSADQTEFNFDNVGYVGVYNLNGALKSLQWGVSYNKLNSFDRISRGYLDPSPASLTNYIASFSIGTPWQALNTNSDSGYNPYNDIYYDSATGQSFYPDWLSTLAWQSYMMNTNGADDQYTGLQNSGSHGDALFNYRERGHVDEYNIAFAGNVNDIVYWGFDIGIVGLNYSMEGYYSESIENATIYDSETEGVTTGNAGFGLTNYKYTSGTGGNLKFGVIVRPLDNLRIGAAIHTPTWMSLSHSGYAETWADFTPNGSTETDQNDNGTPDYAFNTRLYQPWRFMIGASTVIANNVILSADYERVAYNDMKIKTESLDPWGSTSFSTDKAATANIKDYLKAGNIFRVGAEARLNSHFKVRAGYNWQGSYVRDLGNTEIYTAGTDPSYTFNKDVNTFSLGLGYQYKSWYIDATWQYMRYDATYHAFTPYQGVSVTPSAKLTNTYNNLVFTTGLRF